MKRPSWMRRFVLAGAVVSCGDASPRAAVEPLREASDARPDAGAGSDGAPILACGLIGPSTCDPVTAWPCDVAAGESCHHSVSAAGFKCIPDARVGSCQRCNASDASCAAGLICSLSKGCERYCCSDDDCGGGRCVLGVISDSAFASVGSCMDCPPLP